MPETYTTVGRMVTAVLLLAIAWSWSLATTWWFVAIEIILTYDLLDAAARLLFARPTNSGNLTHNHWRHYREKVDESSSSGFAILLSVHNLEGDIDEFLRRYAAVKPYTWIIDDHSSDGTLNALSHRGWHIVRNSRNTNKPGAIRKLLGELPKNIDVVLVSDPDTALVGHGQGVGKLLGLADSLRRSNVDALCPQLVPDSKNWLGRLQKLEYLLSFRLGRASLGSHSPTSGVSLYKRCALEETLDRHSLSVYAEDLENTHILLANNRRIAYVDDFIFETESKQNVPDLFSQRSGWSYGLARVLLSRRAESRKIGSHGFTAFYQYRLYLRVLSFGLLPIKGVAIMVIGLCAVNGFDDLLRLNLIPNAAWNNPVAFASLYVKYTILVGFLVVIAADKKQNQAALSVVPYFVPYTLFLIVPNLIGLMSWFSNRWFDRKIYQDHYEGFT